MKTIFPILFLILGFSVFSNAATPAKKGYLMKVNFQFKSAKHTFKTKSETIFSAESKNWLPLAPATDGIALLGKVNAVENDIINMEYMIVDTTKTPVAVNSMRMISKFGQAASLTSGTDSETISVENVTTLTNYKEAN